MKTIKRIVLLCLIVAVVIGGAQIKGGYDKYKSALEIMPLETAISKLQAKEHYTAYGDVPEIYYKALVAVEDRRFYKHKGFDIIGTARAVYNDIRTWKLLEGGSTISQQLAKNLYFSKDNTLERKIAEILMAANIEKHYDKQQVLEFYVNGIYYGSGYYRIYDAAKGYFQKKPIEMTDSECTLLAGIPNAPSVYSLDVRPDLAKQRQEKVVKCMVEVKYITEDEGKELLESR